MIFPIMNNRTTCDVTSSCCGWSCTPPTRIVSCRAQSGEGRKSPACRLVNQWVDEGQSTRLCEQKDFPPDLTRQGQLEGEAQGGTVFSHCGFLLVFKFLRYMICMWTVTSGQACRRLGRLTGDIKLVPGVKCKAMIYMNCYLINLLGHIFYSKLLPVLNNINNALSTKILIIIKYVSIFMTHDIFRSLNWNKLINYWLSNYLYHTIRSTYLLYI